VNVTADQSLSKNSAAEWQGEGDGVGVGLDAGRLSQDFWQPSDICIEVS